MRMLALVLLGSSAFAQFTQQAKLVGNGTSTGPGVTAKQGSAVALSADGNTAIVGGPLDGSPDGNTGPGAVWFFTRSNGSWSQQGNKQVGTGCAISTGCGQGLWVALSADGNTSVSSGVGVWIFTRAGGSWSQQAHLTGGGPVALSADGNTLLIANCGGAGALPCVYTQSAGTWTQQATLSVTHGSFGLNSVALSADGSTAAVGTAGVWIFTRTGATWTQQAKLTGSGGTAMSGTQSQGWSVALSADGNTLVEGDPNDGPVQFATTGAIWVFARNGGTWTQQGGKLVGSGAGGGASQGQSAAISGDGNTAVSGGPADTNGGSVWVFTRHNGSWSQQGKLSATPSDSFAEQGVSTALSADAGTLLEGAIFDKSTSGGQGAAWVFTQPAATHFNVSITPAATPGTPVGFTATAADANNNTVAAYSGTVHFTSSDAAAILPADATLANGSGSFQATFQTPGSQTITATDAAVRSITGTSGAVTVTAVAGVPAAGGDSVGAGSGASTMMTFTFSDSAGFLNLHVVDVLIASALDGRHACYIAYVPMGATSGSLYLVDDAGDAGGPYAGTMLPGNATVQNSQCMVSGSASGSGATLTLALNISFSSSFSGNKVIYLSAGDQSGANSNWQALATWTVPGAAPSGPSVTGMSPARTNAAGPTLYSFTFNDPGAFQDANSVVNILVNSAIDGRHACYIAFQPASNSVLLVDDLGDAAGPYQGLVLPSNGTIGNSQCAIAGGGSSVTRTGTTLTLMLSMTFSHGFAGNQVFYLAARNSSGNSDWQAAGSLSVP